MLQNIRRVFKGGGEVCLKCSDKTKFKLSWAVQIFDVGHNFYLSSKTNFNAWTPFRIEYWSLLTPLPFFIIEFTVYNQPEVLFFSQGYTCLFCICCTEKKLIFNVLIYCVVKLIWFVFKKKPPCLWLAVFFLNMLNYSYLNEWNTFFS